MTSLIRMMNAGRKSGVENKQLEAILEEWLDTAITTSYLGVTIDDTRTEEDRRNLYLKYRAEAAKQIDELYRQRLIYAVGDDETLQSQSEYDKKHFGNPSADAQPNLQYVRQATRNQMKAEQRNRWVEYPEIDKEM